MSTSNVRAASRCMPGGMVTSRSAFGEPSRPPPPVLSPRPARGLSPEQVEEKFAGRTGEPNNRVARANRDLLVGSRPADLQPDRSQPATQEAATSAHVAP